MAKKYTNIVRIVYGSSIVSIHYILGFLFGFSEFLEEKEEAQQYINYDFI